MPTCDECTNWRWNPSVHMPKSAARIFLRVTDVRVERLQDITEEQATSKTICYNEQDVLDCEKRLNSDNPYYGTRDEIKIVYIDTDVIVREGATND